MTIEQARKLLGKEAKKISDKEILRDIEIATLFKDLLFSNLMQRQIKLANNVQMCHN